MLMRSKSPTSPNRTLLISPYETA